MATTPPANRESSASAVDPLRALPRETLHFGRFELRLVERKLLVDGTPTALGSRALDVLTVLIEHRDRIVTKHEILDLAWPGLVVEENNLTVQVSQLRKVLGADALTTVPGRGYRFALPLAGDFTPGSRNAVGASACTATERDGSRWPAVLPPLIGRDDDLLALTALLDRERMLSIVGAGGVGKTSIAQHLVAPRRETRSDGVRWIELAVVADAAQLASTVAAGLGIQLGGGEALTELAQAMSTTQMLIVLDSAEHLIDPVAQLVSRLYAQAPGLQIVVTSQSPLRLRDERVYRLGGLAVPEENERAAEAITYGAIALFTERAQAAQRNFELDDSNAGLVCSICRCLDGSALAIELAAARVPLLGLERLAHALDQRLRLLTTGNRAAPTRQQTLRAALEWSHGLLNSDEQKVFRRLSVCLGAVDLALIGLTACDEQLDEWAVLDALSGLVDRSLVSAVEGDPPRYRLLESPRVLALEKLQTAGEEAKARGRHASALAQRLRVAWQTRYDGSMGVDDWNRALEAGLDDARAAFFWAADQDEFAALSIGPTLVRRLFLAGREAVNPIAAALLPLLERSDLPGLLRARAMYDVADCSDVQTSAERQRAFELAARLFQEADEPFGQCLSLGQLGYLLAVQGDAVGAAETMDRMRKLQDPNWPPHRRRLTASNEAMVAMQLGDTPRALAHGRLAAQLDAAAGFEYSMARSNLIDLELAAGEIERAIAQGQALLNSMHGVGLVRIETMARANVVLAALARPDPGLARATAMHPHGWAMASRVGNQGDWGAALALLAAVEGRVRAAACLVGFAEAAYRRAAAEPQILETRALELARTAVRSQVDAVEHRQLEMQGANMTDVQVTEIAFALSDRVQ